MGISLDKRLLELPDDLIADAIVGRNIDINRLDAIRIVRSKPTDAGFNALSEMVVSRSEPARIRFAAAVTLARFQPSQVEPVLREIIKQETDPRVVRGALRSLGRIGSMESIDAILETARTDNGMIKDQARFAATLISYREREVVTGLIVNTSRIGTLPISTRGGGDIIISRLKVTVAREVLKELSEDPIALDLDPKAMFDDQCAGVRRLIAFDKKFTGTDGPQSLSEGPAVLGVLGSFSDERKAYSASMSMLATPGKEGAGGTLSIHTSNGVIVYLGTYVGSKFDVVAADIAGNNAMQIVGEYTGGEIRLTSGICARSSQRKRQPAPFTPTRD